MKITRKELKQLIETFIGGKSKRSYAVADMSTIGSQSGFDKNLEPFKEEVLNHEKFKDPKYSGLKSKFETLLYAPDIKHVGSAFLSAKALQLISEDDYGKVRKIISDINLLKTARLINKPYEGPPYKSVKGTSTDELYAIRQAQRDDPNFEIRLSQRIGEIMSDPVVFVKKIFKSFNDLLTPDSMIIDEVITEVIIGLQQKYGKIYSMGDIQPDVKKILFDEFNLKDIVFDITGGLEEYAEYLDLTDLGSAIDEILSGLYDDTPIKSVLKELKSQGYDETFFNESFQDMSGQYLMPNFDLNAYLDVMEYYLLDRIRTFHTNELGFDDQVIYNLG